MALEEGSEGLPRGRVLKSFPGDNGGIGGERAKEIALEERVRGAPWAGRVKTKE